MAESRGVDLLAFPVLVAAEAVDEVDRHVARVEVVAHAQTLFAEIDLRDGRHAVEQVVALDAQLGLAGGERPLHPCVEAPRSADVVGALDRFGLIVPSELERQIGFAREAQRIVQSGVSHPFRTFVVHAVEIAVAQQVIESGQGDLSDEITALNALARKLRAARFRNGSISFEREEAKFDLDENGKPLRVYFKEMKEANQLIEEFMLLANRKVAEFVGRKRQGVQNSERTFVYRVHDKPNSDKLAQLRSFVMRFGYQMKSDAVGKALAKDINKLMTNVHGKQEENLISTLAIRTMAKATYTTTNIGHYGLAFDYYTHFTSPIRRYPDMMVHRLLAHYLAGGKSEDKEYYEGLCEHSSAMEIRAADAERASIKYKMVEFMLDKLDQEFDGHISGVTEWGIYIELDDTKIEGMVSLRDLTDDYYTFDEENYCLRGERTGRIFTLGDGVRIRVMRADLARKQLDFALTATYDFDTKKATPVQETL